MRLPISYMVVAYFCNPMRSIASLTRSVEGCPVQSSQECSPSLRISIDEPAWSGQLTASYTIEAGSSYKYCAMKMCPEALAPPIASCRLKRRSCAGVVLSSGTEGLWMLSEDLTLSASATGDNAFEISKPFSSA